MGHAKCKIGCSFSMAISELCYLRNDRDVGDATEVVAVTFSVSVLKWSTAADVATVMGSVTGVVGTLVGAFLGFKIGSQGKEKADEDRREAQTG